MRYVKPAVTSVEAAMSTILGTFTKGIVGHDGDITQPNMSVVAGYEADE
jgi:hypothetical protein